MSQTHYRAEVKITAWHGDIQLKEPPIEIRGFIPISVEDRSDPKLRDEVVRLFAEGLLASVETREDKTQPKEPTE